MAQQITIDIVAETTKLTSGITDANTQIEGVGTKLKGVTAAAAAAASAFVLQQGVTFLKQGIDEAKEAAETMTAATTTFGEGSAALAKITADAKLFGDQIAVDNDTILQLSTQLGSRLPEDSKALSAELVNLGYDVDAYTGGAVSAEAVTAKLGKAMADGVLKSTELIKIFPDLDAETYAMAETMSKAGDNQGALNLLIDAGQKKYGDAAESNVTASQKLDVALANLKETIGAKLLPVIEQLIGFATTVIDKFSALPEPVQNVVLGVTALVAIGGPLLTFLASAKTALVTLGVVTQAQTASQVGLNTAMLANPIGAVILAITAIIAIGVLLWKNWDTVTETAEKLWTKIKDVFGWVKENWPLLLAILTGPIGLAILAITKNFDEIKEKVEKVFEAIKKSITGVWNSIKEKVTGVVDNITSAIDDLPGKMLSIGKNIVKGLWNGMSDMKDWFKDKIGDFFGKLLPGWAKKMLGISSPSKLFAGFGKNIVAGLAMGIDGAQDLAKQATFNLGNSVVSGFRVPSLSTGTSQAPISITINAGLGTDPYTLGREVNNALAKYGRVSSKTVYGVK